jgi:hypothetical protein
MVEVIALYFPHLQSAFNGLFQGHGRTCILFGCQDMRFQLSIYVVYTPFITSQVMRGNRSANGHYLVGRFKLWRQRPYQRQRNQGHQKDAHGQG